MTLSGGQRPGPVGGPVGEADLFQELNGMSPYQSLRVEGFDNVGAYPEKQHENVLLLHRVNESTKHSEADSTRGSSLFSTAHNGLHIFFGSLSCGCTPWDANAAVGLLSEAWSNTADSL